MRRARCTGLSRGHDPRHEPGVRDGFMSPGSWTRGTLPWVVLLLTGCNGFLNTPPPPPPGSPMLSLVGNFASPVYLTAAPGDTQRLFVVEQAGRVLVLHHDTVQSRPFLDIRGQIAAGGERGLLSLA